MLILHRIRYWNGVRDRGQVSSRRKVKESVKIRDVLRMHTLHITSSEKQNIVQIGWGQGRSDGNRCLLGYEIRDFYI